ncbi:hypothetical protein INP83_12870 [Mucilaginibacter sp. 21P]|uniref:hypothetical protein n=1 Tax=Mucilaginibacter sp. 21P TaxID=2778902 RepID=UPI001C5A489E|nr:hypothetical protein [Mucilaginibacter sp. 21P]QXV63990.1 hypothetical protein INP83_12870 [Mucilaginibacter sp. 21P]
MATGLKKISQDKAAFVALFERNQYYSLVAYNAFRDLNMFQNAHESLCNAYDIQQLCSLLAERSPGLQTSEELLSIINRIEESFDLPPFKSRVDAWASKPMI